MALPQSLPLPDYDRVTSYATGIVDEVRKLPNIAVLASAQTQADIINTLANLNTSLQTLNETVAGLRNDMNTLRTDVNTFRTDMTAQINTLRTDMKNGFGMSEANSRARIHNAKVSQHSASLHPLATSFDGNGPSFPANFPATAQVLSSLRVAEMDGLLAVYNLPGNGSLVDKRRRFGEHIGTEFFQ